VEADGEPGLRKSEDRCRLARSQALPGDQQECLSVACGELAQRLAEASIDRVDWRDRLGRLGQTLAESRPPLTGAALGREHAPSNSQQPGERLARDLFRLPPGDCECFCCHIVGYFGRCSASRVGEHCLVVLTKDRLQAVAVACLGQMQSSLQQEWPPRTDFFQRIRDVGAVAWASVPE
jgi:hypothetical protein